ncbi:MAG: hypothetical protein ACXVAX_06035 [Pseudobdellovibrio sp.]
MKRIDGFLTLNLILLSVLGYTYYYTQNSLDYFEKNPTLKAKYERTKELQSLKKELKEIAVSTEAKRDVASVKNTAPEVVVPSALDTNETARFYYAKAKENCYKATVEIDCINEIDTIVSQFPDTIWAGESLIILSDFYKKNNKFKQADDLFKILRTEFKSYKSIQSKLDYLEKQNI